MPRQLRKREQDERSEHGASYCHSHPAVVKVVNFITAWDLWVPLPYRNDEDIRQENVRVIEAKESAQDQNEERQATNDSSPLPAKKRLRDATSVGVYWRD